MPWEATRPRALFAHGHLSEPQSQVVMAGDGAHKHGLLRVALRGIRKLSLQRYVAI